MNVYRAILVLSILLTFKKILALHFVEIWSSPNSPILFVTVFWGETNRSGLSQIFFKIGDLKTLENFIGNISVWRPATLLQRDSNPNVFLWNLRNFLRTPFLQNFSCGCFWANPGYLCGSLCGEVMLWSFSTSLS